LTLLAKEAAIKGAELKEQLTNEAKRLGTKAWKKAIKMAEAYKNKKLIPYLENEVSACKSHFHKGVTIIFLSFISIISSL